MFLRPHSWVSLSDLRPELAQRSVVGHQAANGLWGPVLHGVRDCLLFQAHQSLRTWEARTTSLKRWVMGRESGQTNKVLAVEKSHFPVRKLDRAHGKGHSLNLPCTPKSGRAAHLPGLLYSCPSVPSGTVLLSQILK